MDFFLLPNVCMCVCAHTHTHTHTVFADCKIFISIKLSNILVINKSIFVYIIALFSRLKKFQCTICRIEYIYKFTPKYLNLKLALTEYMIFITYN